MNKFFQGKIDQHKHSLKIHKRKSRWLASLRLALFLFLATSIYLSFSETSPIPNWLLWLIALGSLLGFIRAIALYRKSEAAVAKFSFLIDFNEKEISRLNFNFDGLASGAEFENIKHPYHLDLDVFGENSLFQLINRSERASSQVQLADWLSNSADKSTIENRQSATKELADKMDWAQSFLATSSVAILKLKKEKNHQKSLSEWLKQETPTLPKWITPFSIFASICLISVIIGSSLGYFDTVFIYPFGLVNFILVAIAAKKLSIFSRGIDPVQAHIRGYESCVNHLNEVKFESEYLGQLQSELLKKAQAPAAIKNLANIIHRIGTRNSMFYFLVNVPFCLDIYLVNALCKWKQENENSVERWFEIIHELECLIGYACYYQANKPHLSFPSIVNSNFTYQAEDLGHPLIHEKEKIRNNYTLEGKGHLDIITGSNMSGKSTFMRTVGTSMIMALAGLAVDATALKMGSVQVFTSMRTKDDLSAHTSSFYAELVRLKMLLDLLKQGENVFFLLDEILKGTNSKDRINGSLALARKLTTQNAFGLIATHDLQLGDLAYSSAELVRNFSFNSTIDDDKIHFDYLLTEGICKSFNASQLMKNIGIID